MAECPCEFINITPLNPLISKCQIKVCYVGDAPNRNKSVITKDVAKKIANSLPGSPIVGYFKKDEEDFDQHSRALTINDEGEFVLEDITKPYGFVDLNARCWFQKFIDDNQFEREYLMTEGYIWTGQYPESKRIIDSGNNQSMELDKKIIDAYWTKDDNGKPEFFIINEAIISKLCILGEEQEPCFEGASITKFEFSLEDSFKQELSSMIFQLQEILDKGGNVMNNEEMKKSTEEEVIVDEFKKKEEEEKKDKTEQNATGNSEDKKEEGSAEEKEPAKKEEEKKPIPPAAKAEEKKAEEDDEEEKKKKKTNFSYEEEYKELQIKYAAMEEKYNSMEENLKALTDFKAQIEKKDKEAMIASFYMLSDEDKKDVVDNIDTYSLEDIENKLSVICVRNKVNFNLDNEKEDKEDPVTYNLNNGDLADDNIPAWVRAVKSVQKSM